MWRWAENNKKPSRCGMILETKYGDPPKPSCSIALVVLGLKGWDAWVIWLLGLVGRWGF